MTILLSVADNLNSIKDYGDKLTATGQKYGCFPKPTKSYLIVKENKMTETQNWFAYSRVNITAEGTVIRNIEYRGNKWKI